MDRLERNTPEGTKDLLFEEYLSAKELEDRLIKIYLSGGYNGVRTPAVEFFDVFAKGCGAFSQQEVYTFSDYKGRILALRPDSTKPVARLVASRLKNAELPIRLFYNQCVYRRNKFSNLMSDEIPQSGIELIGKGGLVGDIEALTIALKCLKETCGNDFMLEIGHMDIFRQVIERCDISEYDKEEARALIERKNFPALSTLLDKYPVNADIEALLKMTSLYGKGEVFEKAQEILGEKAQEALKYLKEIYRAIAKEGFEENIAIDLGLVNDYGYYSGIVFKGYAHNMGEAVLSGGRYDNLYKDYSLDYPAVGFAINTEALLRQKNIADGQKECRPLTLALTKGRLEQETRKLLEKAGISCQMFDSKGRKLIVNACDGELNIVFAKAADVITYVEHGVCDMGVVGKDTIMEMGSSFYEMLDLGFGKCSFVLAAEKGKDFYGGYGVKKVATKYPAVAQRFFAAKNINVDIIKIDGSVELAPLLSLADGIIDITETGTTLKENGLEVVERVTDISARLIVNIASLKIKNRQIERFIEQLKGAL